MIEASLPSPRRRIYYEMAVKAHQQAVCPRPKSLFLTGLWLFAAFCLFKGSFVYSGAISFYSGALETNGAASATSGAVFKGERLRSYSGTVYHFSKRPERLLNTVGSAHGLTEKSSCDKWAVVTTIFEPSEAVKRMVQLSSSGWCTVVVGDRKGPLNYDIDETDPEKFTFLDCHAQQRMASKSTFLSSLPWNHFGRKNLGYLFAIANGAKVVWDFDDDNVLLAEAVLPELSKSALMVDVSVLSGHNHTIFNPYPLLGAPTLPSWPRGQPLDTIKLQSTHTTILARIKVCDF